LSKNVRNKYLKEIEKIVIIQDKIFKEIIADFGKTTKNNKFLQIY
jgi:hypothetical protein